MASIAYYGDRFDNQTAVQFLPPSQGFAIGEPSPSGPVYRVEMSPGQLPPPILNGARVDPQTGVVTEPVGLPIFRASTNDLDRFRLLFLVVGVIVGIAWANS